MLSFRNDNNKSKLQRFPQSSSVQYLTDNFYFMSFSLANPATVENTKKSEEGGDYEG